MRPPLHPPHAAASVVAVALASAAVAFVAAAVVAAAVAAAVSAAVAAAAVGAAPAAAAAGAAPPAAASLNAVPSSPALFAARLTQLSDRRRVHLRGEGAARLRRVVEAERLDDPGRHHARRFRVAVHREDDPAWHAVGNHVDRELGLLRGRHRRHRHHCPQPHEALVRLRQ